MPLHQTVQREGDDVVQVLNLQKTETPAPRGSGSREVPGGKEEPQDSHRQGEGEMKGQRGTGGNECSAQPGSSGGGARL